VRPALEVVQPYVPGRPIHEVRRETGLESVVKLASNEGPHPPSAAAQRAMARAAAESRVYPDPGAWALRDAIAARLGLEPAQVMIGNGVDSLIRLLCLALLDPGDELVMAWPSFLSWRQGALVQGARWTAAPLGPDGAYDLDALAARVGPATKMVVVVSPNNPTGGAVDARGLRRFLDALPGHVLPVIDEAYVEYLPAGGHDGAALLGEGRTLAVARTFSKAYALAGVRVGYLLGPPALLTALARARNVFDVSSVAQAGALAAWDDPEGDLAGRLELARRGREEIAGGLRALGFEPWPAAGNFVYFEPGAEAAARLNAGLTARGVIVRPTGPFGAPGGLRVTAGLPDENARFLSALARVVAEEPAVPA
jgi:histidinol-phosphate aminotransferase